MNLWQMEGRTIKWDPRGGHAVDDRRGSHYSIHPQGRTDEWRSKQRKRRSEASSIRHQARRQQELGKDK